jgi:hypothetical protein
MLTCAGVSLLPDSSLITALSPAWRHAGIFTVIYAKCNGLRSRKIVGTGPANLLARMSLLREDRAGHCFQKNGISQEITEEVAYQ